MERIALRNLIDEVETDPEDKIYRTGRCALCGEETAIDQYGLCVHCGERMVKLENIPLLTIVPIPYIPIDPSDPKKFTYAFAEAVKTFKDVMKEE